VEEVLTVLDQPTHSRVVRFPFPWKNSGRARRFTIQGSPVQLVDLDDLTREGICRRPAGFQGELLVTKNPSLVKVPDWVAVKRPSFVLDHRIWVPMHRRVVYEGPHCSREWMWGRFHDEGLEEGRFSLHLEIENYDGFSVYCAKFGNTVRSRFDTDGDQVDGDLYFNSLAVNYAGGLGLMHEHDLPHQDQNYLITPGRRFLQARRRTEFRFALYRDRNGLSDARTALDFRDRPRVCGGPCSYIESGGYGPERSYLSDMSHGSYYRHGTGFHGWSAVDSRAAAEKSRTKNALETSPYVLHARGTNEGNDSGGLDIQVNLSHYQSPDWWSALSMQNVCYLNRHPEMIRPEDGEALTIHDIAESNGGKQPWMVKRTNGSELRSDTSIPWFGHTGYPWSVGSSAEESYQRSKKDIDHAHSIRILHGLKTRIWMLNSEMAKHDLRCLLAHYQYDPTLYRSDGNSIYGMAARAEASPGCGDGALGRQMGWPLHIYACARQVSGEAWRRREKTWEEQLGLAVDALVSPAGGTRRRTAPSWSYASPPPGLPPGSTYVCDQTFEMRYMAFGAHSIARSQDKRDPMPNVFQRISRHLHGSPDLPIWSKFVAYGDTGGVPEAYKDELVNVEDGTSGAPHHGNLCERGFRFYRDEKYLANAKKWMGGLEMSDEEYIGKAMTLSDPWSDSFQGHQHCTMNWCLDMVALLQSRIRSQDG
jgi:hypothetical protein